MSYDFIDRFSHLDSPLHRRDPRAKIVGVLFAVVVIASTPSEHIASFVWFYLLIAALAALSKVPVHFIAARCLLATPFIGMAAALPFFSLWLEGPAAANTEVFSQHALFQYSDASRLAGSVLLKAYGAIVLLTLLTSTSRFDHLLWGLRRLRAPEVLHVVATLMYRYIFILRDEWRRMARARDVRTPRGLKVSRVSLFGKQVALVFLRGWERAERVQAAMAVRGFTGELPLGLASRFRTSDAVFVAFLVVLFLSARLAG